MSTNNLKICAEHPEEEVALGAEVINICDSTRLQRWLELVSCRKRTTTVWLDRESYDLDGIRREQR